MDVFHRNVIASLADEYGLVTHEFGEEEIDRYVVVYKAAHAPSPDEVARLTLKHTMKIADDTVEKIIAAPAPTTSASVQTNKKKPVVEQQQQQQQDDELIPTEQLRPVGTVKRVRRNAADVMEEVRRKKKMDKIAAAGAAPDHEIDDLFVAPHEGSWDEEEEF